MPSPDSIVSAELVEDNNIDANLPSSSSMSGSTESLSPARPSTPYMWSRPTSNGTNIEYPAGNRFRTPTKRIYDPTSPLPKRRRREQHTGNAADSASNTSRLYTMDQSSSAVEAWRPITRNERASNPPRMTLFEVDLNPTIAASTRLQSLVQDDDPSSWNLPGSQGKLFYYDPLAKTSDQNNPFGPEKPYAGPSIQTSPVAEAQKVYDEADLADTACDFDEFYERLLREQGEVNEYEIHTSPYSQLALCKQNPSW
jgi:hypothetical protein